MVRPIAHPMGAGAPVAPGPGALALMLVLAYRTDLAAMAPGRGRAALMWGLTATPVAIFLLALMPAVALRMAVVGQLNRAATGMLAGLRRQGGNGFEAETTTPTPALAGPGRKARPPAAPGPMVLLRETLKARLAGSRLVRVGQWVMAVAAILWVGAMTGWTFGFDGQARSIGGASGQMQVLREAD